MNKISKLVILGLTVISTTAFTSCGSKKNTTPKLPDGEVEVSLPCTGSNFFSTKEYFRGTGNGESMDQTTARNKALSNARASLATDIESTIKVVSDNYVKSSEVGNREEVLERFENLSRMIVSQKLKGVKQICEKATKTEATGSYKYYVSIELSGAELVSAYNESLSEDEVLKVDYNYEKFKETFNKEMEKRANK